MFPSLISKDIEQALKSFITTGYETETPHFKGKFEALVDQDANGEAFFKGPYVSLGLPFAKNPKATCHFFPYFKTEHSPFAHQEKAWQRLVGETAKPTLVATGTGSGKTECFLYPLLNHCLEQTGKGIKAIIIYPMNALATDQAKRFAEVIYNTPELKNRVNVGLFVGQDDNAASGTKLMSATQVITDHDTLRKTPPDILLTNYKMLDYLLMRPKDQSLWAQNKSDTLKYLVVDELHTFDGAQGSDLAMLIRRLKAHLKTPKNHLVTVGTSATIGSEESKGDLLDFVSKIFDAEFTADSIIGETRVSPAEFQAPIEYYSISYDFDPKLLNQQQFESEEEYLKHQAWFFFGKAADGGFDLDPSDMQSRQELGLKLKSHAFFLKLLNDAQTLTPFSSLVPEARTLPPSLRPYAEHILMSLLALVSHARGKDYLGQPFVSLRFQAWIRELRRIVATVNKDPEHVHLHFHDDLKKQKDQVVLPVLQCSECHATSWLAAEKMGDTQIETDLRKLYNRFFKNDVQAKYLMPIAPEQCQDVTGEVSYLCGECCHQSGVKTDQCNKCGSKNVVCVVESAEIKEVQEKGVNTTKKERTCPSCQSRNSLIIFGSQAASLTSVAISQLFSNQLNQDKKVIAFSDSVQDATHRAGFYSARTWEMNLRTGMAQYIAKHGSVPYLDFVNHWFEDYELNEKNPNGWTHEKFITEFIAPNLESRETYIDMKEGKNPQLAQLLADIKRRLAWEALHELGIKSQTGRSLRRTGVATLYWEATLVHQAANQLKDDALNHLGYELSEKQAQQVLWGICLRLRNQGAIYHQLLEGYVERGGDYYILTNDKTLPTFGSHSQLPVFPASDKCKNFESITLKKGQSWYEKWLTLVVHTEQLVAKDFYSNLFEYCLKALQCVDLVVERVIKTKDARVWGLNPQKLFVAHQLSTFTLRASDSLDLSQGHGELNVPQQWDDEIEDLPSLQLNVKNNSRMYVWKKDHRSLNNFYRHFYLHGQINRVIGHEHTGLLSRSLREKVENQFKAKEKTGERKPWFENLLSATPTLEMGIDIGDLSSVILASVPPSQASYLQRIGRAGRSTGNSVALTVANGQPHDLYFYANPLQMMAGNVEPPAIFLEASMVLKRQLFAYCFDDWGRAEQGKQSIPETMQLVIGAVKTNNTDRFPYTLIEYIRTNRDRLWDEFTELLPHTMNAENRERLKKVIINHDAEEEQIEWVLINRIKELAEEINRLNEQKSALEKTLKKTQALPDDEEKQKKLDELHQEITGVARLKRNIYSKATFNFLTDEGLLPNYAFPEEGTTLKSVIFRKSSDPSSASPYHSEEYEYTRPAHAAISELAPNSIFYASHHKVEITRVETAKGKAIELMRMCPSCSYHETVSATVTTSSCPRCGNLQWADVRQQFPVLKLVQVYANTLKSKAMLSDDSETREPLFFNKQMLVDVDPQDVELAYAFENEDRPFGFEFVKKAKFIEMNFGESTGSTDLTFYIAGKELERPGFRICKECGTVQDKKGPAKHQHYCSFAKNQDESGIEQCLYLYRQYVSEAIRILMPSMAVATPDEQINSFVAAMQLGLKKKFGGKVDHLQLMVSEQPVAGSDFRERYLVIYDSVPGGTGYLHELLADPKHLLDTFKAAQKVMAECSCQHVVPEVDGCYQCLYAYRNSYGMESTSRKVALNMLHELLRDDPTFKKVEHLGKVKKVVWEDSQLEVRFPEALKTFNEPELQPFVGGKKVSVKVDLIKGRKAYHLSIDKEQYRMEMHVQLGSSQGVAYACEPDFIIYPENKEAKKAGFKPIAIFLDGYEYHAQSVHDDLLKRQALLRSGQYWVWSLTWHDVESSFAKNEAKVANVFPSIVAETSAYAGLKRAHEQNLKPYTLNDLQLNSFNLLMKFLSHPNTEDLQKLSAVQALRLVDPKHKSDQNLAQWKTFTQYFPLEFNELSQAKSLILGNIFELGHNENQLKLAYAAGDGIIKSLDLDTLMIGIQVQLGEKNHEETKALWMKLWQLMNWLQFCPNLYAGEFKHTNEGVHSKLSWDKLSESNHDDWSFVFEEASEVIYPLLYALKDQCISMPLVGFELEGAKGEILAEAELLWKDQKIIVLLPYQFDDKEVFEQHGYHVYLFEDNLEILVTELGDKL